MDWEARLTSVQFIGGPPLWASPEPEFATSEAPQPGQHIEENPAPRIAACLVIRPGSLLADMGACFASALAVKPNDPWS